MNKTKHWEYDWVPMNVGLGGDEVLRKMGLLGWEAYSVIERPNFVNEPSSFMVFVKREIQSE